MAPVPPATAAARACAAASAPRAPPPLQAPRLGPTAPRARRRGSPRAVPRRHTDSRRLRRFLPAAAPRSRPHPPLRLCTSGSAGRAPAPRGAPSALRCRAPAFLWSSPRGRGRARPRPPRPPSRRPRSRRPTRLFRRAAPPRPRRVAYPRVASRALPQIFGFRRAPPAISQQLGGPRRRGARSPPPRAPPRPRPARRLRRPPPAPPLRRRLHRRANDRRARAPRCGRPAR